jgi:hypothetical protein
MGSGRPGTSNCWRRQSSICSIAPGDHRSPTWTHFPVARRPRDFLSTSFLAEAMKHRPTPLWRTGGADVGDGRTDGAWRLRHAPAHRHHLALTAVVTHDLSRIVGKNAGQRRQVVFAAVRSSLSTLRMTILSASFDSGPLPLYAARAKKRKPATVSLSGDTQTGSSTVSDSANRKQIGQLNRCRLVTGTNLKSSDRCHCISMPQVGQLGASRSSSECFSSACLDGL